MTTELLTAAVALARRTGHAYLATAGADGTPHIMVAASLEQAGDDRVVIKEWFCPGTLANLSANKALAIAVWDMNRDAGYQLLGQLERIEDLAVADGYAPQVEDRQTTPQVERQLVVHIDKDLDFSLAPHSDLPADAVTTP